MNPKTSYFLFISFFPNIKIDVIKKTRIYNTFNHSDERIGRVSTKQGETKNFIFKN